MGHEHIRPTRTGAWGITVPTGMAKMEIQTDRHLILRIYKTRWGRQFAQAIPPIIRRNSDGPDPRHPPWPV